MVFWLGGAVNGGGSTKDSVQKRQYFELGFFFFFFQVFAVKCIEIKVHVVKETSQGQAQGNLLANLFLMQ